MTVSDTEPLRVVIHHTQAQLKGYSKQSNTGGGNVWDGWRPQSIHEGYNAYLFWGGLLYDFSIDELIEVGREALVGEVGILGKNICC